MRLPQGARAAVHRALLDSAVTALSRVLEFRHPADSVLSRYFRLHPDLGQGDRAFVAEAVFGVLRRKRSLEHLTGEREPRALILAWLARHSGYSARALADRLPDLDAKRLTAYRAPALEPAPPAVVADLPDWLFDRLARELSADELTALGRALAEPAPLDLRVNSLRAERAHVIGALARDGIEAAATPYSPVGVRIAGKPPLHRHALYLDGTVEVQDEGSQLIGLLVAPRRHDLVVDFCAGAGGKTLMLGAMMRSRGRIYAFDVSAARLARLKDRVRRAGLSNVQPHLLASLNDAKVKRLAGKVDSVLVDAPCSGFGTLRRNPDLKWRHSPAAIEEMRAKQRALLESASRLVRPGGRLVYATCSLLGEENEDIVAAFLTSHPEFAALDCAQLMARQGVRVDTGRDLKLRPHVHGTDGFYAAVLERAPSARPA
jgi:16S rRNA (cytosine967-C5)-methyltransferase